MALSDKQKLRITIEVMVEGLYKFQTWSSFKNWVDNITKAKFKDYIKNRLQEKADELKAEGTSNISHGDDIENIKPEI